MSYIQPKKSLPNEDGYASDGSWFSDFDDSPESSKYEEITTIQDFSEEIKDNQINENIEANLYVNIPPLQCSSEKENCRSQLTKPKASPDEFPSKSQAALPKTAFSYLSNDLNKTKNANLFKNSSTRKENQLDEIKNDLTRNPVQPMKDTRFGRQNLKVNYKLSENQVTNEKSTKVITHESPNRTPSKLKPEAFSFLDRVTEKQYSQNRQKVNTTFKSSYTPNDLPYPNVDDNSNTEDLKTSLKSNENYKYESCGPMPLARSIFTSDKCDASFNNKLSSLQVENATGVTKTIQMQAKEAMKPPLPTRPPPIFKYPPEIFAQKLPGSSKTEPTFDSAPPGQMTSRNENNSFEIYGDEIVDIGEQDKNCEKPVLSNDKRKSVDMSERPLPPLPASKSKFVHRSALKDSERGEVVPTEDATSQLKDVHSIESVTTFLGKSSLDLTSKNGVSLEKMQFGDQNPNKICKPEVKPKPKTRLNLISQQTNVSDETFITQREIATALAARLQMKTEIKPRTASYEQSPNESPTTHFLEQDTSTPLWEEDIQSKDKLVFNPEEVDASPKRGFALRTNQADGSQEEKKDMQLVSEMPAISRFPWYHSLTAKDGQLRLLALGEDGTFLIRPSSNITAEIQSTLCVVYNKRVFNLHIRQKPGGQYALGKEKVGEKVFSTISGLIKYHQNIPIEIRPFGKPPTNQELIRVYLRITPPK